MSQAPLKSSLALAAGAPASTTVTTDASGLTTALATLPGGAPAYVARPSDSGAWPVILIAQEIFGLHAHIRDVARRFAKIGYYAIAPDYLIRYGDPAAAPDIDAIRAIVARVPDAVTMSVFDDALAFAAKQGGDAARAAITGFCWGGRIAWLYAAHRPDLKACVPWYGRLDGAHTDEHPRWPVDLAGDIHVPTLGLYGGADPSIPVAARVLCGLSRQLSSRHCGAGLGAHARFSDKARRLTLSEIAGDAFDLPIAVTRRIEAAATADLGRLRSRFGLCGGAARIGFRQRPSRRVGQRRPVGWICGRRR